jgi:hypothetical protein
MVADQSQFHDDRGDDIILEGHAGDIIDDAAGNNIVLGDHGVIDYVGRRGPVRVFPNAAEPI